MSAYEKGRMVVKLAGKMTKLARLSLVGKPNARTWSRKWRFRMIIGASHSTMANGFYRMSKLGSTRS